MNANEQPTDDRYGEISELKARLAALQADHDQLIRKLEQTDFLLRERVKELKCHNRISEIINQSDLQIEAIVLQILQALQEAFLFPDATEIRIQSPYMNLQTSRFNETRYQLSKTLFFNQEIEGTLTAGYLDHPAIDPLKPFLIEEDELLATVSVRLQSFIEFKRKDIALQERETRYKSVLAASPDVITITDMEGKIIFASRRAAEMFGADDADVFNGTSLLSYIDPADHAKAINGINQMIQGHMGTEEYIGLKLDGTRIDIEVNGEFIRGVSGDPVQMVFVTRDISERKRVERALKESNERALAIETINHRLSLAIEQSPVSVVITNLEGRIEYANPKACASTGYSLEELIGQNPRVLKSGETSSEDYKNLWEKISRGEAWKGTFHNKRKNGELYWESSTISPIIDQDGLITHYLAIKEDITERREAEQELKKFRLIVDQANYGNAIASFDGKLLYVNHEFAQMHGYRIEEIIGKNLSILHPENQLDRVREAIEKLRRDGNFRAEEIVHIRKDGTVFPSLMNAQIILDENNNPQYMWASAIDITKVKEAELALRKSEEMLNLAQEIGGMGSWELDLGTQKVRWSQNLFRLLGIESAEPEISNQVFFDHIYPEDKYLVDENLALMMKTKEPAVMELRMITESGNIIWLENNIIPLFSGDMLLGLRGAAIEITRKKEYEEQIQRQNERLNAIIRAIPDLIFVLDRDGIYKEVYCSDPEILATNPGNIIGRSISEVFSPEETKFHTGKIRECLDKMELGTYEYTTRTEGKTRFWEARITPLGHDQVLSLIRDITVEKQNDAEIKKLSLAVEQSPISIVITGLDGVIDYINPAFVQSCGYSPAELIGTSTRLLKSGKTELSVYQDLWATITVGKTWQGELINKKKNGELFWENVLITPIFNEQGIITNFLALKMDITQRKQDEQQIRDLNLNLEKKIAERTDELSVMNANLLREIEERRQMELALKRKTDELEKFFNVAIDLLCIADLDGNFIKLNKAWEYSLGYSLSEIENRKFLDFVHPDDIEPTLAVMNDLYSQNPVYSFTNRYRTKSGEYRFIEWRSAPSGNMLYSAARDVTEQKRAYEFELELLQLSTKLTGISVSEIGNALNLALQKIGQFLDVDRSYIFEIDFTTGTMSNTYEWCNEGISAEKENLQNIPLSAFPQWIETMELGEIILIPSVRNMPEKWKELQDSLEPQGIQSLVIIPILIDNKPFGFLGLDAVRSEREFKQSEINTLKVWNAMISGLFIKLKNESLLEMTRQNYEIFFNTIDDFLFVIDPEGKIVHSNNTVRKRLGYDESELLGQHILNFRPSDRREEAEMVMRDLLTGRANSCSIPLVTKSGEQIPVETRVNPGLWNGKPIVFGVSKDISQIKLSEQKFSTAFQSNSAMMAISLFEGGEYLDVNHEFTEVLGYSREELIGRSNAELELFVDPSLRGELLNYVKNNIPVRKFEILMRTKDGTVKTGLLSADSIYVGDKHCLLTVTMDISERKKAEEEIKKARNEAEQANTAKSEFLSRMSHELRTPLNSILGFGQLLQMGELTASQVRGVNHIMKSGKHLLDLINEVLDITRIEAGKLSLSIEPVQVSGILTEISDSLSPLASERQVKLIIGHTPDESGYIRADRQRIKQVILNLVTNAIKYNHVGGEVHIRSQALPADPPGTGKIRILITDTGIGISDDDIPKLFKPFERIGAEKSAIEGSGLGLAVVWKLMAAMEGAVGVKSEPGKGSTFWIDLPATEGQIASAEKSGFFRISAISHENITGTILYVEDNQPNVELVEQIIHSQRPGIRVISCPDGLSAPGMVKKHRPDLILLDLNLPDIHGADVFRNFSEDADISGIPVIVISADAMPHQMARLLSEGVNDYITKPIDVNVFVHLIDKFIPKKK